MTARHIPTAPALAAVTALAQVLRETGGKSLYAHVKHDGTARIVVEDDRRTVGFAVLATREMGCDEWVRVDGDEGG
jgi:hypothetical protein